MKASTDSIIKNRGQSDDFWKVTNAGNMLANQACTLSARHMNSGTLRLQFNREVAYYAKAIINDVEQGKRSSEEGLKALKDEQSSLLKQSTDIAQKGIGAVAGAFQFAAGAGICYGSVGTLCFLRALR